MGTDIHLFIEYKIGDQPWQADKHHLTCKEEDDDDASTYLVEVGFAYRHYQLFGRLAGVRHAYGENPPLGLPDDVSTIIKSESDRWDSDGHSHSYSSLEDFERSVIEIYGDIGFDIIPKAFRNNDEHCRYGEFSYINIVAYCKEQVDKLKMELESEKYLLGQDTNTEVQCRLVYWFDN
jgi:hypothetical protein